MARTPTAGTPSQNRAAGDPRRVRRHLPDAGRRRRRPARAGDERHHRARSGRPHYHHRRALRETKEVLGGFYTVEADDIDRRSRSRPVSRRRAWAARSRSGRSSRCSVGARMAREPVPSPGPSLELEQVFRDEWGRVLATLIGFLGDFDLAEEATQDAFTLAAERWPRDGRPPPRRLARQRRLATAPSTASVATAPCSRRRSCSRCPRRRRTTWTTTDGDGESPTNAWS